MSHIAHSVNNCDPPVGRYIGKFHCACISIASDDPDKVDEQFTNFALLEDIALKGFTPLISHQDTLVYQSSPEQSNTKQVHTQTGLVAIGVCHSLHARL